MMPSYIRVGTFSGLGKDEFVGTIAESRIESRGEKGKESMSTLRRLLVRLGSVGTLLGAGGEFFVSGLPPKTTSDLDEEVHTAFEAWARSGSEVASSALRSADQD
jgi:hypothetical protein